MVTTKRIKAWETLLKARAIENMCYVVGVNRTGKDDNNYDYSGNSLILDYFGEELNNLKQNEIGVLQATFYKNKLENIRYKLGFLNDRDSFTLNKK